MVLRGWVVAAMLVSSSLARADDMQLTDGEKKMLIAGEVVVKVVVDKGVETVLMATPLARGYQVYQYVVSPAQDSNELSASLRAGRYIGDPKSAPKTPPKPVDIDFDPPPGWKAEEVAPPKKIEKTADQKRAEENMRAIVDGASNQLVQTGKHGGLAERAKPGEAGPHVNAAQTAADRAQMAAVEAIKRANDANAEAMRLAKDDKLGPAAEAHADEMHAQAVKAQGVADAALKNAATSRFKAAELAYNAALKNLLDGQKNPATTREEAERLDKARNAAKKELDAAKKEYEGSVALRRQLWAERHGMVKEATPPPPVVGKSDAKPLPKLPARGGCVGVLYTYPVLEASSTLSLTVDGGNAGIALDPAATYDKNPVWDAGKAPAICGATKKGKLISVVQLHAKGTPVLRLQMTSIGLGTTTFDGKSQSVTGLYAEGKRTWALLFDAGSVSLATDPRQVGGYVITFNGSGKLIDKSSERAFALSGTLRGIFFENEIPKTP